MDEPTLDTRQLVRCLERMRRSDAQARDELLNHVCASLEDMKEYME